MKKNKFQPKKNVREIAQLVRPCDPGIIFFDEISRDVLAYAPIHYYLRGWCDGSLSRQCLHQRLTIVAKQEHWHGSNGVEEHRALHLSNCVLVEMMLRQLAGQDEREVERAA